MLIRQARQEADVHGRLRDGGAQDLDEEQFHQSRGHGEVARTRDGAFLANEIERGPQLRYQAFVLRSQVQHGRELIDQDAGASAGQGKYARQDPHVGTGATRLDEQRLVERSALPSRKAIGGDHLGDQRARLRRG
jgi:hypothetical protein